VPLTRHRLAAALLLALATAAPAAAQRGSQAAGTPPPRGSATADPVVAQRGTDTITAGQLRTLLATQPAELRQRLAADPKQLDAFLRNELLQRALAREAAAARWDRKPDIAAAAARAAQAVVASTWLASRTEPQAAYPSDAELQTFYDQNSGKLLQPRQYHLAQVFEPATPGAATDAARRTLDELRSAVLAGRRTLDQAGARDLGWLPENRLVPEVKAAVSGLQVGALAPVLCIQDGCHLIRLIATRPAGPAPLAEIRQALIAAMRQQHQAAAERAYADALLAREPVQVNEIELAHQLAH
jgi:parvulin-like peptidyl-prolyl isomerase